MGWGREGPIQRSSVFGEGWIAFDEGWIAFDDVLSLQIMKVLITPIAFPTLHTAPPTPNLSSAIQAERLT